MGRDEEEARMDAEMGLAGDFMQEVAERQQEIKEKLPPEVYEGFCKGWGDWIDHTKDVMNIGIDPTEEQAEDWHYYMKIFMTEPHSK